MAFSVGFPAAFTSGPAPTAAAATCAIAADFTTSDGLTSVLRQGQTLARSFRLPLRTEPTSKMSLVIPEKFQHILRVLNTNIDGRRKIAFAITAIKADIDLSKRAGELTDDEVERVVTIMQNPRQYKIPDWFLNRQKDVKDGKYSQFKKFQQDATSDDVESDVLAIAGVASQTHLWKWDRPGLRVRGQHTKTTGRRGRTVGVSKKK
ncbi:hypothetical protein FQN60_002186 [Etheostoma spectabile]|uniref:Small ribosomal subunit protein uS13 n=1 Tax=Etheostoma spectabile TaxID=54343 RepID=A0A5J5DCS4_9PERO|nr:hypothetical protein FQN60_002186 [Etheostoma spectabile]